MANWCKTKQTKENVNSICVITCISFFTICNGKIRKFLDVSHDESFDSFVKPCPGLKPPVELSDKAVISWIIILY